MVSVTLIYVFFFFRTQRLPTATGTTNVHKVPDTRTGKGVSLQSLFDTPAQDRDCARTLSHRETNKDMVPESTHEIKEGTARRQGNKRTGAQRAGGTRQNETAAAGEASQAGEPAPRPPRDPPPRPHEDAHRQGLQRHPQSE